jgi:hypothetical protein
MNKLLALVLILVLCAVSPGGREAQAAQPSESVIPPEGQDAVAVTVSCTAVEAEWCSKLGDSPIPNTALKGKILGSAISIIGGELRADSSGMKFDRLLLMNYSGGGDKVSPVILIEVKLPVAMSLDDLAAKDLYFSPKTKLSALITLSSNGTLTPFSPKYSQG